LTLLAKNLEISDFWVWVWGIETFHRSKFSPDTGIRQTYRKPTQISGFLRLILGWPELVVQILRAKKKTTHEVPKNPTTHEVWEGGLWSTLAVASSDIADEEIASWRMRLQPFLSHKNSLTEFRRASSVIPWIALLGRKVFAVPTTFAAPKRMFSATGNIMTTKRARLTCNYLEELMYLHEVWPKVREWTVIKKARLA